MMAETRIITATFELLYGTAEFKSTDTTRSDRLGYSYNGSKFTYVPEEWIDLEPWTDTESEFETKLLRDGAMHFAGNWLETLVGIDLEFHGAESQAFMVDGIVFEALSDPDDGYRSLMAGVLAHSPKDYNFYEKPFTTIRIEKIDTDDTDCTNSERMHGYQLVDTKDKHVWLTFGTEWYDEYYPMFRFEYTPKKV